MHNFWYLLKIAAFEGAFSSGLPDKTFKGSNHSLIKN